MEWNIIIAFIVAIPVILFPVAFIWYMNLGSIYTAIKKARAEKAARQETVAVRTKTVKRDSLENESYKYLNAGD